MSIFATGSFELKGGGSPSTLIFTASQVTTGPRVGVGMAAAPNTTFAIGGDLGLTDTASDTRFSVVNTNAYINAGTDTNNRGFMLWENGNTRLRFGTKQGGVQYFSSLILKDGNAGIGGEPTTDLQVHGGDVMLGDGALGVAAKVNFGNSNTYIERPTGSSTWRFQTDRPVIFDTGGGYSLYANSFTFKNANESKKIFSVSQTQDLADSTEQTKIWVHEDDADLLLLLKDPSSEAYEISNGTELLKLRGTAGTGAERMSTIVTGSGNLHVRTGAHITGSIYLRASSRIVAPNSAISFNGTDTIVSGQLRIDGNEIKASDGGDVIHWDTDDNVQIGNLGSTTGTLQINGNEIKKNGGTTMIDFPAVLGDPTRLSGDLQINGNAIKNSASSEVISLGATGADPVIVSKDLRVGGNDIQDAGGNITLGFDGSGNINQIGNITATLDVDENVSINGGGSGGTTLFLGNQVEEDLRLLLRGNVKFGYLALDDSLDKLCIGEGTTAGSSAHISMNLANTDTSKRTEVTGSLELTRSLITAVDGGGNTLGGITTIGGATTINDESLSIIGQGSDGAEINLWANEGAANDDKWRLRVGTGNPWLSIQTLADGVSYKSFIDLKTDASAADRKMCVTGSIGLTTGKIRVDTNNLELLVAEDHNASDAEAQSAGARITMNSAGEIGLGTTPATGYVLRTKDVGGTVDDRKVLIGGDLYVDGNIKASSGQIDGPASGNLTIQSEAGIVMRLDHDNDTTSTFSIVAGSGNERLSLSESGDLQIDGEITVDGTGTSTFGGDVDVDGEVRIFGSGGNLSKLALEHDHTTGGNGPEQRFNRTNTDGLASGDNLGEIWFRGSNNSSTYFNSAAITGEADGTWDHSSSAPGRLAFFTSPAGSATVEERMRITNQGNVGIGSTNASTIDSFRLLVEQPDSSGHIVKFHNTSTNSDADVLVLEVDAATPGTTNNYITFLKGNGTTIGEIEGDGTGATPGGVRFTGDAAGTYSDMRLKTDLRPIENAVDTVKSLEIYDYEMIGDSTGARRQGFSAQQLLDVSPQSVYTPCNVDKSTGEEYTEDDPKYRYMRVNAGTLTPLLAAALQEALAKIDNLTSRIEILENS